jgi:hypothetical protein
MRHVLKLSSEALQSPYIGHQLAAHGYWTCENGDHLAHHNHYGDPDLHYRRCQMAADNLDWLADAKIRAKQEIAAAVVRALELTPLEAVRRRAIASGSGLVPSPEGFVIVNAAIELARIVESENAIHANGFDLCRQIDASMTMVELRSIRDPAMAPGYWNRPCTV